MAKKTYAQRNAESILNTGKSLYQRRLESAKNRGLTSSQARGHAKKNETPASKLSTRGTRGTRAKSDRTKAPKIKQQVTRLPRGAKRVTTYSTEKVFRTLQGLIKDTGTQRRVYFEVWDAKKGKFIDVYRGGRNQPHGITIEEFLRRVDEKLATGQSSDIDEAIRDTITDDSNDSAGGDSPGGEGVDEDEGFTQIRVNILPDTAVAA